MDYVTAGVSTEMSDERKRPQWLKRDTKTKEPSPPAEAEAPSPPAEAEADVDDRLWAGASAAGWRFKAHGGGHYTYTAPDGTRFHNRRAARDAADHTVPSSGAGAGTEVGGPSGGSGARAVDGAEATAPGRADGVAGVAGEVGGGAVKARQAARQRQEEEQEEKKRRA